MSQHLIRVLLENQVERAGLEPMLALAGILDLPRLALASAQGRGGMGKHWRIVL
jgi:hypothetical protein